MTRRFVILFAIFSSMYASGSIKNYKRLNLRSKNPMNLQKKYTPGQPVDISQLPNDYCFAEWKMEKIEAPLDCAFREILNNKDELDKQLHGHLLEPRVIVLLPIAQRNAKIDEEKRSSLLGWRHHRRKKK